MSLSEKEKDFAKATDIKLKDFIQNEVEIWESEIGAKKALLGMSVILEENAKMIQQLIDGVGNILQKGIDGKDPQLVADELKKLVEEVSGEAA